MNIQWSVGDSRVNCGLCQNLDLASSIMFCSYWLTAGVCLLAHARVWAGCLQVLAPVLTRGQRRLHALSVLTDIRLLGRVWGLEATTHWTHVHTTTKTQTHTKKKKKKRHKPIFHESWLGCPPPTRPRSWNHLQFPPALFITSRPSSADLRGTCTYLLILPSSYNWLWWIDLGDLWPLTFLTLPIPTHTYAVKTYNPRDTYGDMSWTSTAGHQSSSPPLTHVRGDAACYAIFCHWKAFFFSADGDWK